MSYRARTLLHVNRVDRWFVLLVYNVVHARRHNIFRTANALIYPISYAFIEELYRHSRGTRTVVIFIHVYLRRISRQRRRDPVCKDIALIKHAVMLRYRNYTVRGVRIVWFVR